MDQLRSAIQEFISQWGLDQFPSLARILESMDLISWTLVLLFAAAVVMGIFFSLSSRRTFLAEEDVEATTDMLLARLKQDPSVLPPTAILSRLGAEATLGLLEYGDRVDDLDFRYRWGSVRNELLYLLSNQNAFGPNYALARYYRSAEKEEPDTLRIRRTALIHKLGITRHLEPNADGSPAQLRIRCHPAEVVGDLGFDGSTLWLMPAEPAPPPQGPFIEMDPVEFDTLEHAALNLNIRRTPMAGGGFRINLEKRRGLWVVVGEDIEWAS
ncbi:MAG: hypothetical protein R3A44_09515 [Caldilineaceae bacterium]